MTWPAGRPPVLSVAGSLLKVAEGIKEGVLSYSGWRVVPDLRRGDLVMVKDRTGIFIAAALERKTGPIGPWYLVLHEPGDFDAGLNPIRVRLTDVLCAYLYARQP